MTDACAKPTCRMPPSKTYEGPNGNTIEVCRKCYWRLVTGKSTFHTPTVPRKRYIPNITIEDDDSFLDGGCLHDGLDDEDTHAVACPCPKCSPRCTVEDGASNDHLDVTQRTIHR